MQRLAIQFCVSLVTFIIGVTVAAFGTTAGLLTKSGVEQEILRVEREYLQAHLQRDTATLDRILADDFTFGSRYGRVTNKAARLALVGNPDAAFIAIETSDVDVRVEGDKGFVTGRAYVVTRDRDHEYTSPPYRYTRVFEKRQGSWQIVSTQIMHRCAKD